MSQKTYSLVESTETNVGRLLVDVASTINHVRKYKVDFKYSFSGIPDVALSPTNLTSSDSLGISPDLRYYITAINITKSSMEIQIIVDQGTSVRLSVDYVAVYHNITNPMKSFFGKKVTICNITMDAYLRNRGTGVIDMSGSKKTFEVWLIEDAGSGNVYFKSVANGKYLNSDKITGELGDQDKSDFQRNKSIIWTVSGQNSNIYNITDEYNKKLQAIDSTYEVMTNVTSSSPEENEFEIKLI